MDENHLLDRLALSELEVRGHRCCLFQQRAGNITQLASVFQENIIRISITPIFEGHIKVLVYDTGHLEQLTREFEQVEGVKRVVRWDKEDTEIN